MADPKLDEIAKRIGAHLSRFADDPEIAQSTYTDLKGREQTLSKYWTPNAFKTGTKVGVKYVGYQNTTYLSKAQALSYLAWLDAGNVGRHYECEGDS